MERQVLDVQVRFYCFWSIKVSPYEKVYKFDER